MDVPQIRRGPQGQTSSGSKINFRECTTRHAQLRFPCLISLHALKLLLYLRWFFLLGSHEKLLKIVTTSLRHHFRDEQRSTTGIRPGRQSRLMPLTITPIEQGPTRRRTRLELPWKPRGRKWKTWIHFEMMVQRRASQIGRGWIN